MKAKTIAKNIEHSGIQRPHSLVTHVAPISIDKEQHNQGENKSEEPTGKQSPFKSASQFDTLPTMMKLRSIQSTTYDR